MKKSFITFCALVLLATQTPIASATAKTEGDKGVRYERITSYKTYKDRGISANLKAEITTEAAAKKAIAKLAKEVDFEKVFKQSIIKKAGKTAQEKKVVTEQPTAPKENVVEKETVTTTQPTDTKNTATEEKAENPVTEQAPEEKAATEATTTQPTTSEAPTNSTAKAPATASDIDAIEAQVIELTNAERTKAGLQPLEAYTPLMAAAREKSQDMKDNNYFSHTSPTFGSPFDRLKALGISYKTAGENIAKGQRSAEEVVEAWMNSEGHRANILNGDYTHIGVGLVKDGYIWTQQFIKQ